MLCVCARLHACIYIYALINGCPCMHIYAWNSCELYIYIACELAVDLTIMKLFSIKKKPDRNLVNIYINRSILILTFTIES